MVRQRLFVGFLILSIFARSDLVFSDCPEVLARVDSFPQWSLEENNLRLAATDLFPQEYLRQVETQLGPWHIQVIHRPERGFVQIVGTVRSRPYVRVKLIQDPRERRSLIVDELNLQDPLQKAEPSQLNPDQMGKGLPPQVFKHIKEQLFKIAKAGGYEEIRTNSQQHFAVVMLYKRFVGMEPANATSQKILDQLDGLYSFARRELPEDLRPGDVEEFTRWLGTGAEDPSGLTERRLRILETFLETGKEDPSFTVLKNKKGEMVAALFKDSEKAKSNLVFFDLSHGKPQIFNWFGLAVSHHLELVRKL